jgi:hypothetical protein
MIRSEEHYILDEEDRTATEIEEVLESDVRHYWELTRRGPHDECLCHEFYVADLKDAIKRLRNWRAGAYGKNS